MTQKRTQTPKATLPGYLYQRSGRWWWRVRLPGENRTQARPLRKNGETRATQNRKMAEQMALSLWQEALAHETENRIRAKVRTQAQEKSRAYAYLIDLLCEGLLHNPRLPSTLEVPAVEESFRDISEEEPVKMLTPDINPEPESESVSESVSIDMLESPLGLGHVSDMSDILFMLSERQNQNLDQTGCDCCGARDFYEEYLHRIDSGQRLCPRCFKAFQEKVRQMGQSVCNIR